ncbi:MAG: HlyD family efflux transporter periplasmic adaptor subunit, partial [Bacteroidota bacterium]|nr:HlyD family efflux transporter periplasmic adaptor subunit [Bacteroidota bacterium]
YDASGSFEATEVIVSAEANGKIMKFGIDEGQQLEAGQNVGYIDSIQLYLRKMQLLANIKAVESRQPETPKQIAATEQQIATQLKEKRRVENLLKANVANQKQLDDINAQISLLEKQLEAQKSSLTITSKGINEDAATLRVQVEQLNDQLQKCRIISPIKGTVLVKYAEQGELAASGKALFKIANIDYITLRAYVAADLLTKLKIGQKVKVYADYGESGNRQYPGTITWISDKSEFTPKTVQTQDERNNLVYAVKIVVKNDGYLKIGMYGGMKIGQ